jgi:hypothetical protein
MQWLEKQIREGMNTRTYLLVGTLVAVLLWIHSLDEKTRAIRARAADADGGGAPAPAALAVAPDRGMPATPTPPGWGDDPFDRRFRLGRETAVEPTGVARGAATRGSGLYLQGVMNGPRGRTALINGDVVREGDRIAGKEVLQIGARSVLVLDHGTVITLSLKGEGP